MFSVTNRYLLEVGIDAWRDAVLVDGANECHQCDDIYRLPIGLEAIWVEQFGLGGL